MLHHVLLEVSDLERSASFYDALLAPLGWRRHFEEDETIGWGSPNRSSSSPRTTTQARLRPAQLLRAGIVAVKAAWEAGSSGGGSVAEPGERRSHGSGSYSAFLKDPDGYEIEVTVGSD
jgi:catechol 2,3-dioxygenase-like lactoylglutathione lyase family enzyme